MTAQKAKHGDHDPVLFPTLYYLGIALHHLNKPEDSLSIFLTGLEVLDLSDIEKIANARFWIGKEYDVMGEYNNAVDSFVKALAQYKELNHIVDTGVIIQTLHSLGNAHLAQGHLGIALKVSDFG